MYYNYRYDHDQDVSNAYDVHTLRTGVSGSLIASISSEIITFVRSEEGITDPVEWTREMSENARFADHHFIQLTAELLNRQIIIYSVFSDEGTGIEGSTIINPSVPPPMNARPLTLLYYSDTSFVSPHYQSITRK